MRFYLSGSGSPSSRATQSAGGRRWSQKREHMSLRLAVAFACLVVVASWNHPAQPAPANQSKEHAPAPQNTTRGGESKAESRDIYGRVVNGIEAIANYCADDPKNKSEKWLHQFVCNTRSHDVAAIIVGSLVFFVTLALAIFSWWQVCISRNTAKRQLRAYVGFNGAKILLRAENG